MESRRQLRSRCRAVALAAAAVIALVAPNAARGDTLAWTNSVSGNFATAANWTVTSGVGLPPPAAGDIAVFDDIAAPYTVTFSANQASDALNLNAGTVTFVSSGGQRTYDVTSGAADVNVLGGTFSLGTAAGNGLTLNTGGLLVRGGSQMNVRFGSDVTATTLGIANTGASNGTLLVMDAGSTLTITGTGIHTVGNNGSAADFQVTGGATANIAGAVNLGVSGVAGTTATMHAGAGSTVTLGSLNIMTGVGGAAGQGASVSVGGTLTLSGASTLAMGHSTAAATSFASLGMTAGGVVNTGTGAININKQASITSSGGTFNANGNMTITAGRYEENIGLSSNFNLAAGRTLTVQGGGLFVADNVTFNNNTIVADGIGTTMLLAGNATLSSAAAANTSLTVRNSAAVTTVALWVGAISGNTVANVSVESGGALTTGTMNVGIYALPGVSGNVTLTGGTIQQTIGSAQLNVGAASGDTSTVTISGGEFNTGTGTTTINATGRILMNGPGIFNANGDMFIVNGGQFVHTLGGIFAMPGAVRVGNNGVFSINNVWGTGTLTDYRVDSGGDFTIAQDMDIAGGTFVVRDNGSTLTVNGLAESDVGFASNTATLVITSQADAHIAHARVAGSSAATGTLLVDAAADATFGALSVAPGGGTGTVTVSGAGSSVSVDNSLTIGSTSLGAAVVDVNSLGALTQPAAGYTLLRAHGTLNITDGTVMLGAFDDFGTINFNSGTFGYTGTFHVGLDGTLGDNVTLGSNRTLLVNGPAFIEQNHQLTLDGGRLSVTTIDNQGTFLFNSGLLTISGAGGLPIGGAADPLGRSVRLAAGQTLNVNNNAAVSAGGTLTVDGGSFTAASVNNSGMITFAGGAMNVIGTLSNNAGGALVIARNASSPIATTINNAGEIYLDGGLATIAAGGSDIINTGLIRGDGRIAKLVNNNPGGELRLDPGTRIRAQAGFANAGQINLLGGAAEFTLPLTNTAAGLITGRGTLVAGGGLTNNGQMQISGGFTDVYGAVTGNSGSKIIVTGGSTTTFYDPVTLNAGSEFRVSANSAAVFFGHVTGHGATTFNGSGQKIFEAGSTNVGAIVTTGATIVESAAAVTTGYVREASLTVNGEMSTTPGGGTSRVGALEVGDTGSLDLSNNKLIVAGGDVGTFDGVGYSGLSGRIAAAYNFSSWDGAGIKTSQFDAGPLRGVTTLAIATADEVFYAGGTFGGLPVASGDVLVMYTYAGDLNLDGLVDGADYGYIDNYVQFPGTSGYTNGDINYDGVIDGADYGIIDNSIQLQGDPFPGGTYGAASTLAGVTAVPEPAACGFALLAAASLLGRRREKA